MNALVPPMTPQVRAFLYGLWAWGSLLLTLATAGFAAVTATIPDWVVVILAVWPVAGAGLGFVAKANVPQTDAAEYGEPIGPH